MTSSPHDIFALGRPEWRAFAVEIGQPGYRGEQIHRWIHVDRAGSFEEMTNLSKDLRRTLSERFGDAFAPPAVIQTGDSGTTFKALFRYGGGLGAERAAASGAPNQTGGLGAERAAASGAPNQTGGLGAERTAASGAPNQTGGLGGEGLAETVLMAYPDRATVCISSQAGCGMGCPFCATGQMGLMRNLTAGEIVSQVLWAARTLRDVDLPPDWTRRVSNVVFMGMGEPLANFDRVWEAIERIHDPDGFNLSARGITVSTVGVLPGIRKLAAAPLPVTLALSLHAPDDELRSTLVPLNERYPIADLLKACRDFRRAHGRRVSIEYAMIAGVNDSDAQARTLARLLDTKTRPKEDGDFHVNLIPLNPTPGFGRPGSSPQRIERFRATLESGGVNATVRQNRGTGIDAACGQLGAIGA